VEIGWPPEAPGTGDSALIVVDNQKRILFMNDAASLLFAKDASLAEGTKCWEVMGLRTLDGKPFCGEDCPLWQQACNGIYDEAFHLTHSSPVGAIAEVSLKALPLYTPEHDGAALLQIISPITPTNDSQTGEANAGTSQGPPKQRRGELCHRLTKRETEVLKLLAGGRSTTAISDKLGISPVTVRNHLQNVMKKLEVHRRLDAVVAWMKSEG
jgi:DNA-binding CsgD family transcriptional regulator